MRVVVAFVFAVVLLASCATENRDFSEATITELQSDMQRGALSSEDLVHWYLDRIEALDASGPSLNSIIEVNPDALATARALDVERLQSGVRGPLHGIPVVLKANINTADQMVTSAGSAALKNNIASSDAFVVKQLRDAGAVILAKSNLSEWANFRSTQSSSGWSSIGGQTLNPYDTRRSPCGSSSGSAVAVAANLSTVAIGTETDGSVVCPSGINGIVGIKPTLGLISRSGIIPIAHSQDTAGPMARSVHDAAILLSAMTGVDAADEVSKQQPARLNYASGLRADALHGKRIGVLRNYYGADGNAAVSEIYAASIDALREAGAVIVDDIKIPTDGMSSAEYEVLLYEFKHDLNAYLAASPAAIKNLSELIAFNDDNAATVMPIFGQEILLASDAKGSLQDDAYKHALATSRSTARQGLDSAFEEHALDALVAPTNGPAWMIDPVNGDSFGVGSSSLAAISGYPSITVPAGFASGLPIGLTLMGKPWNEKQLIALAYAFEQTTEIRQPPRL